MPIVRGKWCHCDSAMRNRHGVMDATRLLWVLPVFKQLFVTFKMVRHVRKVGACAPEGADRIGGQRIMKTFQANKCRRMDILGHVALKPHVWNCIQIRVQCHMQVGRKHHEQWDRPCIKCRHAAEAQVRIMVGTICGTQP